MTQDQYGQPRGTGYVVRGEVVPDDETEVAQAGAHAADEAGAVRSPDPADTPDPSMTRPGTYGTTAGTSTGTPTGPGSPADTAAGYGGQGGTAADQPGLTGTGPAVTGPSTVEAGPAGKHAGPPAEADLRPGEPDPALGDFSDLTYGSLLPDAAEFRAQWKHIQFMFVDDPRASVTEAAGVIAQVSANLEAAIAERLRAIQERQHLLRGRWGQGVNADTETLRETLRMYRVFLDQLTGPTGPTGPMGPTAS